MDSLNASGVKSNPLVFFGLLFFEFYLMIIALYISDLLSFNSHQVRSTQSGVDSHDEESQIAWLVIEHELDRFDSLETGDWLDLDFLTLLRCVALFFLLFFYSNLSPF